MKKLINHSEAIELEYLVRRVYNCGRHGVMGIADADHLEYHPLDAANVILAPLYLNRTDIPEIDNFIDGQSCIFNFDDNYAYDEKVVRNYIDGLRSLVDKYYKNYLERD